MNLREWAELISKAPGPPDGIELRVKDTMAAFLTGVRTSEGQALARLYGGSNDRAQLAAAAAAIARLSECDDIHLASCVTPGAVVIPVALAFSEGRSEEDFNRAISTGYAAGLQLGCGIGGARALAGGVWPTLLAAPLMAAVTASCLAGHDRERIAHAMALALGAANGRAGRPAGTPSGRWFLLAEAVLRGLRAADAAGQGFKGDLTLLAKPWLAAQAGHDGIDMRAFGAAATALSLADTGYKPFPIARQGANAVAAFQRLLAGGLDRTRIDAIQVFVPAINVALLSRPALEDDRLSRLSNIGFQLACAALAPEMLYDSERAARPLFPLLDFAARVSVAAAGDLDAYLPERWAARVVVNAGRDRHEETVVAAPFDQDAADLPQILGEKWRCMLSPGDLSDLLGEDGYPGSVSGRYAMLWQGLERRVSMAANRPQA